MEVLINVLNKGRISLIKHKFLKYFLDELIELMNLQERDQLISYLNNSVHWRRALSDKFGERPLS